MTTTNDLLYEILKDIQAKVTDTNERLICLEARMLDSEQTQSTVLMRLAQLEKEKARILKRLELL